MGIPLWRPPSPPPPDPILSPAAAHRIAFQRRRGRAYPPRDRSSQTMYELLRANDATSERASLVHSQIWRELSSLPPSGEARWRRRMREPWRRDTVVLRRGAEAGPENEWPSSATPPRWATDALERERSLRYTQPPSHYFCPLLTWPTLARTRRPRHGPR